MAWRRASKPVDNFPRGLDSPNWYSGERDRAGLEWETKKPAAFYRRFIFVSESLQADKLIRVGGGYRQLREPSQQAATRRWSARGRH
jgi:hypothetical protein